MTKHPAKFSNQILDRLEANHADSFKGRWLDPFAGTGKGVDWMNQFPNCDAVGIELEPEWAGLSPSVMVGDATKLPFANDTFDGVFTSPCYGNRMADHHNAKDDSKRNTYRHQLGRPLTDGSAAGLQWGDDYRELHVNAWWEVQRVLRPGGRFYMNIKDHIRKGVQQEVSLWHKETIEGMGLTLLFAEAIDCPGQRQGQNGQARVDHEWVYGFVK